MHLRENRQLHFVYDWGLKGMYWNIFLRSMGVSLMGLFFPIFVFLIAYEKMGIVAGLRLVLFYLLIQRALIFLFNLSVGKWIERIGFRWSVLMGTMLSVFYFIIVALFGGHVWVVVFAAVFSSIAIPLYWNSRFALLSLESKRGTLGKEFGLVELLQRGGGVLAPVLGGVIVTWWGFDVLFGVGAVIMFLSSLPVFFMNHHVDRGGDHIGWRDFVSFFIDKQKRRFLFVFVGESWESNISGWFWPIYLFLILGNYELLGGITAIALTLGLFMSFVAGWLFDKKLAQNRGGEKRLFVVFSLLLLVLRILRAAFTSLFGVGGLDIVTKLVSSFYYVPYGGYLLDASKKERTLKFFVYRETVFSLGAVLLVGILWLFMGFAWRWWLIFGLSGLGLVLSLLISKPEEKL